MQRPRAIEVTRKHAYNAMLRAIRIEIDGREVGKLRNDQTASFPVSPGSHRLVAKIDWMGSKAIDIDVREGEVQTVTVEFCDSFRALFAIFGFVPYLELHPLGAR